MRQIQLSPRPEQQATEVPKSWRPWDPVCVEPLFMAAARPEDFAARVGGRFQETWEDGLGRIHVAPVALLSGSEVF